MAQATEVAPLLTAAECTYTRCYCEENCFLVVKRLAAHIDAARIFAVFISNPHKTVPIWQQRSATHRPDGVVIWDYHVIVIVTTPGQSALVYDLDTLLPFPCAFSQYAAAALGAPTTGTPLQFHRYYRIVPAPVFLRHFASDRRHMVGPDGGWMAPPPAYACIQAADGAQHTLPGYVDMPDGRAVQGTAAAVSAALAEAGAEDGAYGVVADEAGMLAYFLQET